MISVQEAIVKSAMRVKRRKDYQESFHRKYGPRSIARLWTGVPHPGGDHSV